MTEPIEFAVVATSFEDLYLREYPGLIAVATALSGRDGEDLVQDAMVKALVSWDKVRRLERPGGWCHRVLVNLCRSRWRRLMTEARFLSRVRREEPSTPGPSDDVMAFWSAIRESAGTPTARCRVVLCGRPIGDGSRRHPRCAGRNGTKRSQPCPFVRASAEWSRRHDQRYGSTNRIRCSATRRCVRTDRTQRRSGVATACASRRRRSAAIRAPAPTVRSHHDRRRHRRPSSSSSA